MNLERLKFWIYESAAGVRNEKNADEEYVARLVRLARASKHRGKYRILAFDKHYDADGTANLQKTNMYVPNRYVVELAQRYPDIFLPVISIHPYRSDALQELEQVGESRSQIHEMASQRHGHGSGKSRSSSPFYRTMKERNMILLSHAGEEQAVEAEEDQRLGKSTATSQTLGYGRARDYRSRREPRQLATISTRVLAQTANCFDLFLRLMDERKYAGLLFGEISAMLQFNRMPVPFATILKRQDLHARLVNGSDYPLPAINALIRTRSLARDGFITAAEREALNEIYDYNPLLFDFVLKRTIRHPETKQKLAASVFMENPGLEN